MNPTLCRFALWLLIALVPLGGCSDGGDADQLWAEEVRPSFSPDGGEILFAHPRAADLCAINPDGTNLRRLLETEAIEASPAFSPDGRRIAFTRRSRARAGADLYTVDADGGDLRQLTDTNMFDFFPAFSPDGQWIVFARAHIREAPTVSFRGWVYWDYFEMPADGGEARQLTYRRFYRAGPACYNPDGDSILFSAARSAEPGRTSQVYRLWFNGPKRHPELTRLSPLIPEAAASSPDRPDLALAPDGGSIVSTASRAASGQPGPTCDLIQHRFDSDESAWITDDGIVTRMPHWTPDGRALIYLADPPDQNAFELRRVPLDGGEPTVLTSFQDDDLSPP